MLAKQTLVALLAGALSLSASADPGRKPAAEKDTPYSTPAPSVDDGLGELRPYAEWQYAWAYSTPAEKIDSGLGNLPHYSEWQYSWIYSIPAEKIDSGLGEIRPLRLSTDNPRIH